MMNYLEKFNNLDIKLREKISSPKIMEEMKRLEEKYRVKLATVVMRLMVNDISILDLSKLFMFEEKMEARHAEALVEEMKKTVLYDVADYLGFTKEEAPSIDILEKNELDTWKNRENKASVKTSDFFFSTEDEEEVRNLAKKLEHFKEEKQEKGETIETIQNVEEIIKESVKRINLRFSSDELLDRFKSILTTYVKNVRNKIDVKETLMKDIDAGGMDLNDDLAQKIIKIIDEVKKEYKNKKPIEKPKRIKLPEDASASSAQVASADSTQAFSMDSANSLGAGEGLRTVDKDIISGRDVDYDFSKLKKDKPKSDITYDDVVKEDVIKIGTSDKKSEKIPLTGSENKQTKKTIGFKEINLRQNKEVDERTDAQKEKVETNFKNRKTFNENGAGLSDSKIKMEDVKFVPKLTGPIDELKDMSLKDFRRLGGSPKEMTDKILEKINFLEKESYKKRLDGIKAWRLSPVNKAYLAIGQKSIESSMSLRSIISEMSNQNVLNIEEFNAIMELNKSLRF